MNIVKILDIQVDIDLLNINKIAAKSRLSHSYVNQLLNPNNKRKNRASLRRVRNSIITLYGGLIKNNNQAA